MHAAIANTPINRFRNKEDLEKYARSVLGKEKLDTYLVPDWQQIQQNVREAKIRERRERGLRDEFEHMINWKRVFEQIWTQIRWL